MPSATLLQYRRRASHCVLHSWLLARGRPSTSRARRRRKRRFITTPFMKLSALCQGAESDLHSAYVAVLANEALHRAKNQPQIKATVRVCLSQQSLLHQAPRKGMRTPQMWTDSQSSSEYSLFTRLWTGVSLHFAMRMQNAAGGMHALTACVHPSRRAASSTSVTEAKKRARGIHFEDASFRTMLQQKVCDRIISGRGNVKTDKTILWIHTILV